MSLYPCDGHGGRYRGPADHAYVAIVHGASAERRTLRLCPDCSERLADFCAAHFSAVGGSPDGYSDPTAFECVVCSLDAIEPQQTFVTLYRRVAEREDFWGVVCVGHRAELAQRLSMH